MAKRSNNSLGRRAYGGKPYDANNSFVKKMANKVTDFMPQRSWISKWFNASQDNGDASACEGESFEEAETEEEVQHPPTKRPRIRMDVTHPPGTFFIRPRERYSSDENDSRKDPFARSDETEQDFLEPSMAGPSGMGRFISSTSAGQTDMRNSNIQRADLNCLMPSDNNGATNGADDNSESSESTSGCSSLIPQTNRQEGVMSTVYHTSLASRKRLVDDKLAFTNHLQSPRCLFLDGNNSRESLSSRRPSFNASIANNTLDRGSSLSSPFYSGNVTFGGANALGHYKRSRSLFNSTNEFQLKVPRRTSVQVKPSSSECIDASGMSQTARRILEAMEYFSSPITDAKKIPVKKGETSEAIGRKRSRDEQIAGPTARVGLRHLTRELAVPTVPEMLKLRRRQKLQDTTLAARKIVSATSGPPPVAASSASSRPSSVEYHLRTDVDQEQKFHGKLRTKSKKNADDEAPAPDLNLPRISLDIKSLPSFEPPPKYAKPSSRESTIVTKSSETESSGYKFASPIKISESAWNLKSINNFSFSKPLSAVSKDDSRDFNASSSSTMSFSESLVGSNSSGVDGTATNFMWTGSSTAPRLKTKTRPDRETGEKIIDSPIARASSELKTGSVMDVLGGNSGDNAFASKKSSPRSWSKSLVNIWECGECYIKNDWSKRICVACKAPKPSPTRKKLSAQTASSPNLSAAVAQQPHDVVPSADYFGSQFTMSTDQWECSSCLVRNKQNDTVCVSCTTPRPKNPLPSGSAVGSTPGSSSSKFDLMDKFKPAEGSWECSGCMLRNPSTVITCPCCNASKPSTLNVGPKKSTHETANEKSKEPSTTPISELMEKFKPATSSWECSSCMVRNNETTSSCVCCSNPKPGCSSSASTATSLKSTTSGWGDKFIKPDDAWSCDSCMLQNKPELTECVACGGLKPGAEKKDQKIVKSNFSFGIPANATNSTNSSAKTDSGSSNGFTFGVNTSNLETSAAGKFTFGIPASEVEKTKISSSSAGEKPTGFVFASPKSPEVVGFKFDADTKTNASDTSEATKTSSSGQDKRETFTFGLPKAVGSEIVSDRKETIFGGSSSIGNGKSNAVVASDGKEAGASFGVQNDKTASKSTTFGGEVSRASGEETARLAKVEPATANSTLVSASTTLSATSSSAFSTETRPAFTFSDPNSKPSGFGETSSMSAQSATASSTFSTGAQKTSSTSLSTENKQSTMSGFGIGTVGTMPTPFGGTAATSSSSSSVLGNPSIETKTATCTAFGATNSSGFFGMADAKKEPSASGTVEKKSSMFGSAENKPSAAFECTEKTASSPIFSSPSPAFGQPAAAPQQPIFGSSATPTPVFGNSSVPSFGTPAIVETPIIFATGKTNVSATPTSAPLFTFGASALQPSSTPASAGFGFSVGGTSGNAAAKPIFPFGSAAGIGGQQPSECFASGGAGAAGTFGTPASLNSTPSPFAFNAPAKQEPPAFGQASATISKMFGAQQTVPSVGQSQPASNFLPNQPTPSTGFNFGAPATAPASSGGFNFGGNMSQPASAPASGFNFNAPSASPSIAFDPNTRPSFNFTGGSAPTVFNATPQPATARKIKKAVRRMPQR